MNKAISGDALAHIWAVSTTEVPSVQGLNSYFECLSGISVELQFKQAKNFDSEHKCFNTLFGVQEIFLLA